MDCTRSRVGAVAPFVAILLWLASASTLLAANTYYVSSDGDDGAAGTADAPWRTLQRAANQVAAGDTVIVRTGGYAGFVLGWDFPQNGTPGNPITFHAEPGVVINLRNNKTPDGINLEGASYIVIEGFAVNGIDRAGIRSVQNNHVIIRNNQTDQNGKWGIFTSFSDDVLIENNVASRSRLEHGIYVSNSTVRPVVRGNLVWGNHGAAIHMNGDLSQGGVGLITDALVEANVAYDNGAGGGSGINCDGVQNSRIVNNLLYNNHASGISLYQIDAAEGAKNNLVAHNTIVQAADGRWALNIKNASTGNVVYNNILYNHHPFRGSINIVADSLSGFISNYNVVMERFSLDDGDSVIDLAAWRSATGQDLSSIVATPDTLFVNESGGDFHLVANSPAVDAGLTLPEVTQDIEGTPRPSGLASDIGAYEFASGGNNQPPTAVASGTPTSGVAALTVKFDGTRSFDPDGQVVSYAWQFGDGASASGSTAHHAYAAAGTFTATLTVTDNQGATATSSLTIVVKSAPTLKAPRLLKARVLGRTVTLGWTNASKGQDGVYVERARKVGSGPLTFKRVGQTHGTANTYSETVPAGQYVYRVQAFVGSQVSGYSATVSIRVR